MTAAATTQEQTREQWLAERRTGIGGSDAASIMDASPRRSAYAIWADKLGLVPSDDEESEEAEWGKRLESAVALKYREVTGRSVNLYGSSVPKIFRHARLPFMLGSLDADVVDDKHDGPGVFEIKTTGAFHADDWVEFAPLYYQVQLQHYLAVTGRRWGSFAVLIGGQKFKWYDVERNDAFIATLEARCAWFWGLVQRQEAPPVDGSESTTEALKAIYPGDSGETIDLGGEAIDWVADLDEAKSAIAALEEQKRGIENKIRAAMGSAAVGVVPGAGKFTLKLQTRAEHVVQASSFRPLRWTKAKEKK